MKEGVTITEEGRGGVTVSVVPSELSMSTPIKKSTPSDNEISFSMIFSPTVSVIAEGAKTVSKFDPFKTQNT